MPINFMETVVVIQEDCINTIDDLFFTDHLIADIGYKVDKTNEYVNNDHHCMESDLVFIRFEVIDYGDEGIEGDKDDNDNYICHCRGDKNCIFCGKEIDYK